MISLKAWAAATMSKGKLTPHGLSVSKGSNYGFRGSRRRLTYDGGRAPFGKPIEKFSLPV